ncbi:ATP-binding protein [Kitasatospora sp. NPDC085879]|uniref:ATP-binding protein n=1 Tax=Kitasatospora sp. NPDC085879 TaxID=3154769 RepID=UPI003421AD03
MSLTNAVALPQPRTWDVSPDPADVPTARRLIRKIAESWDVPLSDSALRDIELCADELLANTIEHSGIQCRITVRWSGQCLRVEVADSSLRPPRPDRAGGTATGGRGLALVEAFSRSWGWYPVRTGKVVWFEVAADELTPHGAPLVVLVRAARTGPDLGLERPA